MSGESQEDLAKFTFEKNAIQFCMCATLIKSYIEPMRFGIYKYIGATLNSLCAKGKVGAVRKMVIMKSDVWTYLKSFFAVFGIFCQIILNLEKWKKFFKMLQ